MGCFAFGHFGMPLHEKRGCVGNASHCLRRGARRGLRTKKLRLGIARTTAIGSMGFFVLVVFSLLCLLHSYNLREKQQEIVVAQTLVTT